MADFLLTFELEKEAEALCIHGDEVGLRNLQQAISQLLDTTDPGHFNHEHLKTPAWGGVELSEESQGGQPIQHVKLYCWKGKTPQP